MCEPDVSEACPRSYFFWNCAISPPPVTSVRITAVNTGTVIDPLPNGTVLYDVSMWSKTCWVVTAVIRDCGRLTDQEFGRPVSIVPLMLTMSALIATGPPNALIRPGVPYDFGALLAIDA